MAQGDAGAVSLPRDAVSEILFRAPVKSLCRFQCVSKEWQAIISDRAFVAQHKSRTMQLDPLLVTSYIGKNRYADTSVLVMDTQGTVVREIKSIGSDLSLGSCLDNLICVGSGDVTRVVDVATGTVLLASEKPSSKKPNGNLRNYVIRLGRAAVSGSYKAVRIRDFRRDYGVQPPQTCEVSTIGRRYSHAYWRTAQPPPTDVRLLDYKEDWAGATVDGVVYFLSMSTSLASSWDCVLGFDLETEEWRKRIDGPIELSSWTDHTHIRITELNQSLCMIKTGMHKTAHPSTGMRCNIWLLTDRDKSTWVKAYYIQPAKWCDKIQPLRVMPDGVRLLYYNYDFNFSQPHVLRIYDPRDETCTIAMNMPNNTFNRIGLCSLHLEHFVVPPKYNESRS